MVKWKLPNGSEKTLEEMTLDEMVVTYLCFKLWRIGEDGGYNAREVYDTFRLRAVREEYHALIKKVFVSADLQLQDYAESTAAGYINTGLECLDFTEYLDYAAEE